jgi:hypothetical protein
MQLLKTKQGSPGALAPIAVKILLCRGSAQKIATDSGKKLQKIILHTSLITNHKAQTRTSTAIHPNLPQETPLKKTTAII